VGTGRDRERAIEVDDDDVIDLVARHGAHELPAEADGCAQRDDPTQPTAPRGPAQ
jgi:hypothetical protein